MINIARRYLGIGLSGRQDIMHYYNKHCVEYVEDGRKYHIKLGDEWCAAFASVVAHKAGIRSNFPFEVSAYYQLKNAQEWGTDYYNVADTMENDLVFFDWNGNGIPNHVGIVVSHHGGILETIEGNKDSTVAFRKIMDSSPTIIGFVRTPNGHDVEDEQTIDYMARAVIRGQYGQGEARKTLLGDDYELVQKRVNEILS